jgi:hypothetical protein
VTLVAIVAALALLLAASSLLRVSRKLEVPLAPEERTFATLAQGDVVATTSGDWLVAAPAEPLAGPAQGGPFQAPAPGATAALVVPLRAGRAARFLFVPAEGPLRLLVERPATLAEAPLGTGLKLERATVDLLPGT